MYREAAERPDTATPSPKPQTTTIEYRAWRVRARVVLMIAFLFFNGLAILSLEHATHFVCTGGREGRCTVASYAIVMSEERTRDFALRDIVELKVDVGSPAGGQSYALVTLVTRGHGAVDVSNGTFDGGRFNISDATNARGLFHFYQTNPKPTADLDVWLAPHPLGSVMAVLFAIFFFVVGGFIIRGVRRDARPVRIVVDRERGVVTFPGDPEDNVTEVAIDGIADIELETDDATSWERSKDEKLPGYRIVFITKKGKRIPTTSDRRPKKAPHDRAFADLRAALPDLPGLAKKTTKKKKKKS